MTDTPTDPNDLRKLIIAAHNAETDAYIQRQYGRMIDAINRVIEMKGSK